MSITLETIEISITSRCNLDCHYCCFKRSSSETAAERETNEWLLLFKELSSAGTKNIVLTGGEPLVRDDLQHLLNGIASENMKFQILSNGTLFTASLVSIIKETGSCNKVQVSIDANHEDFHDCFRGKGSFQKALRGIRLLQDGDIPIEARVTLHKKNYDKLPMTIPFILDTLNIKSVSVNPVFLMGKCLQNEETVLLSDVENAFVMKTLLEMDRRYPDKLKSFSGPLADAKKWLEFNSSEKRPVNYDESGGRLSGCGCVWHKIGIRSDGVYVPCLQLGHIELGKINEHRLLEIWQNHPLLLQIKTRNAIPLTKFRRCRLCRYRPVCTGNCPALAYIHYNDINLPSPDGCLMTLGAECIKILKTIQSNGY